MVSVLVLLGAPGAGKGTQASRLSVDLTLPHVATGDLFRENIGKGTELGEKAKSFMNSGKLVPDQLVLDMLFDRVGRDDCGAGYLLDGFPRTLPQAHALDSRMEETSSTLRVAELQVDEDAIVQRAADRLLCRGCTNIHHSSFAPPSVEGVCDSCGGELYRRDDDAAEVVRQRLKEYRKLTHPLSAHYSDKGFLTTIDGSGTPDEVFALLSQWGRSVLQSSPQRPDGEDAA